MSAGQIKKLKRYYSLAEPFRLVKNISFKVSSFENRFPLPEAMTDKELDECIDFYKAMGSQLADAIEAWEKAYEE